jgi:putative inorganic carbon (hco3(-)) transporter
MRRWTLMATFGSVVVILISIAFSQFLLGIGLVMMLRSREQLRFPPVKAPLLLLFIWTIISALHSGHFVQGLPQIRKFFVFGTALLVCTAFKTTDHAVRLFWLWFVVGVASSAFAFTQLWTRYQQAHAEGANYYEYFLDARLHGFASHWMTFGGELMIVSLLLLAAALWERQRAIRIFALACLPVIWTSLVLGLTRSVFLVGVPAGATYLLLNWRRWSLVLIPATILLTALLLPFQVRERLVSVVHPHGNDDSNARRLILTRTGLQMIRQHPIFGVGPEQVGRDFLAYVPGDIPRPLPKGWYGHLHNVYLQFAAERGLPALAFLLWILGRVLVDLAKEARNRTAAGEQWVLHGAVAVTLGVMAEGLFEHNLGDSEVLTMFLAVISCGYVVKWRAPTQTPATNLVGFHLRPARLAPLA